MQRVSFGIEAHVQTTLGDVAKHANATSWRIINRSRAARSCVTEPSRNTIGRASLAGPSPAYRSHWHKRYSSQLWRTKPSRALPKFESYGAYPKSCVYGPK